MYAASSFPCEFIGQKESSINTPALRAGALDLGLRLIDMQILGFQQPGETRSLVQMLHFKLVTSTSSCSVYVYLYIYFYDYFL